MKVNFSSRMLIFILFIFAFIIAGNSQNALALTPVADLTGNWLGFAQLANVEGTCEFSGKVNADIKQNGNTLVGGYSFVTTSVKTNDPDNMGFECQNFDYQENFRGTLDGSRITLNSDGGGVFTGWYASSGIKLDLRSDELVGTAQLSPTGFNPQPVTPQDTIPPVITVPRDMVINITEDNPSPVKFSVSSIDETDGSITPICTTESEPTFPLGKTTVTCTATDKAGNSATKSFTITVIKSTTSKEGAENENISQDEEKIKLIDVRDKATDLLKQKRYDEALPYFDKYLENHPDDIITLKNKVAILGFLDRNIEALSYIDKILTIDPNDSSAKQDKENILTQIKNSFQKPENESSIVEAESYFIAGGERGEICNYILNKANPCRELSGKLKPGDMILTKENNFAIIKLDNGKSTIYLGPNSHFAVLQINEKLRLFYLPDTSTLMKAEIHDKPEVITKFGICQNDEKCAIDNMRYFAWIQGTQLIIERHFGEDTKITVLEGHVGILKGNELIPIVTIDTNKQLIFKNDLSQDTKISSIDPESIDQWWDKALALEQKQQSPTPQTTTEKNEGGCLIATATFGSELAPQVQQLRELRDNSLLQTASGTSFMTRFNQFYYSFSPIIADWERESPVFKEAVKITLTPMIYSLSILNYVNMDSESNVLVYGISLFILNVGMYFVSPTIVIHIIRKKF